MVEARKNYPGRLLTPAEVWERLNAGELKLGIGWPTAIVASNVGSTSIPDTEAIELAMRPYPLADEIYLEGWRVAGESPDASLLSPTGLTVGIAAACRQTGVARTFVSWLVSREGHQAMRGLDDSVLPNRLPQADVTSSEPAMVLNSGVSNSGSAEQLRVRYDDYLRSQLSTSIIRPTLRIAGAAEYLRILNEAVLVSLSGEQSAQQSLSAAAEQWNALSDRLGRQTQLNAWRQSQGMRER
jgi:multiple sugar transport system substrate-binding protein